MTDKVTGELILRLYVAGDGPNSSRAKANLKKLQLRDYCKTEIEIVDILEDPLRSLEDGIRLSPTLLRVSPAPAVFIIGDLRDRNSIFASLGLTENQDEE